MPVFRPFYQKLSESQMYLNTAPRKARHTCTYRGGAAAGAAGQRPAAAPFPGADGNAAVGLHIYKVHVHLTRKNGIHYKRGTVFKYYILLPYANHRQ